VRRMCRLRSLVALFFGPCAEGRKWVGLCQFQKTRIGRRRGPWIVPTGCQRAITHIGVEWFSTIRNSGGLRRLIGLLQPSQKLLVNLRRF
jgi:hypothetical protein